MKKLLFLAFFTYFSLNSLSFSHQGGLNSDGCHNNKKNGEYHCHQYNPDSRADGFRIIDGDTIHFNFDEIKIRFNGIDTPEMGQVCQSQEGPFDCGAKAREVLKQFIGLSLPDCITEGMDVYGRILAECFVEGESISKYLVKNGYAFAYRKYSNKFIDDENYAKNNNLGLWNTEFAYPWDYRSDK